MRWVYLSPHFDDVVLSCGGLVWEQAQMGQAVEAWTICAGSPPRGEQLSPLVQQLHERWETGAAAVAARLAEDQAAFRTLNVDTRYWDLPDCIYRRIPGDGGAWLANGGDDLWLPVHPKEMILVDRLCEWLASSLVASDQVVSPLTLGNHVDHRLTRLAAERAASQVGFSLWYYPDYPYAVQPSTSLAEKTGANWRAEHLPVSQAGLKAWQQAVLCYQSQLSSFWSSQNEMEAALDAYWQAGGGATLWRAS
ncbi:MAG TPA: PIG-L family deacetylase [Anaerolineaceae bacterium]